MDATINPSARDIVLDGIDQNCDGGDDCYADADGDDPSADDTTAVTLGAGFVLNTGNSNNLAINGKFDTTVRRGRHQFIGGLAGVVGANRNSAESEWLYTAANVEARMRYDGFIRDNFTAFVLQTTRHDRFQSLDARVTVAPGLTWVALGGPTHTLTLDGGYELQYDRRTEASTLEQNGDGNIILDGNGAPTTVLDQNFINHSARLATGYGYKYKEAVSLTFGMEFLQSFIEIKRWRINSTVAIDAKLAARLSMNASVNVRFDNLPLPGVQKLDTTTMIGVNYSFF